ncbi:MAG: acetoacetate decarboxylase family protein [Pseudomonadota bacterium]
MGFVKTLEEIAERYQEKSEFYDAEMLTVYFETKPEVVERLLPPPLKPAPLPLGGIFVANYPRTNFGVTYLESAILLQAEFNGEEGAFCLSMPVTNDIALILGREVFGYPKKIGNIHLERKDDQVEGWTERRGVRFLEVRAKLTGSFNDQEVQKLVMERMGSETDLVVYNFKYFPAPDRGGFDYNPRLIKEVVEFRPSIVEMGEAQLVLRPSDHDPWADVEIVRVLGAIYTVGNNTMLPGSVVAEVDQMAFAPYAFMKLDAM